jgi:hypothetical protein
MDTELMARAHHSHAGLVGRRRKLGNHFGQLKKKRKKREGKLV